MKTVIVTGGSRGIGKAIVEKFAKEGYNVMLNYNRSSENAEKIEKEFKNVKIFKADVTNRKEVQAMIKEDDFIACMEYGMPPISGWGMGIDRFVALLTNQENLREVVLFPTMKPLD